MKVIVAGLSKTGTKSMQAALQELGYNHYDYLENFMYLRKEWMKIFKEGGNTEDFYRMFKDVDSVTDIPGCCFWDEIHKAFPEAKIILTMRESEDIWFESCERQLKKGSNFLSLFGIFLSPTMAKLSSFVNLTIDNIFSSELFKTAKATFGTCLHYQWFRPMNPTMNPLLARMLYRRHNSHVLQTAPKDKLLVFNIKDGWEPLCQFLDVDVPNKPFPHRNINGNIVDEYNKTLPIMQRAKKEVAVSMTLLLFVAGFGVYKIGKRCDFGFFSRLPKIF